MITKKNLEAKLSYVRRNTKVDIVIGHPKQSRRYLALLVKDNGIVRDLSPHLTIKDLYEWLDAFDVGYTMGYAIAYHDAKLGRR